ncbi:pre-mRNA-splicing factor CWC25 homolog [Gastrophryne carolinensis]
MGGGDLNLKKSWHPQTLRNVEKVWKAEQKHEAEKKKIEELQRELRDERAREEMQRYAEDTGAVKKKDEKLDWMYQGPAGMVNRDEYLLGRPVDKFILDKLQDPESGPSTETGLKREDEKKKEVLNNPVKMKKIKELLQSSLEKKSKKKKKEKKKRKKERRSSSSDEDSSREQDKEHKRSHRHRSRSSSPTTRQKVPGYGLQVRESSKGFKREDEPNRHRDHSRSPHRERAHDKSRAEGRYKKSPSPKKEEKYRRPKVSGYTKKLSAEELEQRRLEMMDNAKQREVERENNVRRYKQEDEREEKKSHSKKDGKFLHNMKLESATSSSLEDRVKRNIHGIQRTASALEKNFMKR